MRVFENFDAKKTQTLKLFGDDNLNNTYTFSYQNFNIMI